MRTAILLAVLALATTASAQSAPITTEHDRTWSKASTAYAYKLERNNEKHLHQFTSPVKTPATRTKPQRYAPNNRSYPLEKTGNNMAKAKAKRETTNGATFAQNDC